MALTERKEIGSMNVLPMGQIEVRTDTVIEKDVANQDVRVRELIATVHTPEVKKNWKEFLERQEREND